MFFRAAKENKATEIARTGAEQLIPAANFALPILWRDVDKLSQLPRNCRVPATYHTSNFEQRAKSASVAFPLPATRVPSYALRFSLARLSFRAFTIGLTSSLAKPASSTTPLCIAWQSFRNETERRPRLTLTNVPFATFRASVRG